MDTLLQQLTALTHDAPWSTIATGVSDLLLATSAFIGALYGVKGIRKYLMSEFVKERIRRANSANQEIARYARNALPEIDDREWNHPVLSEDDEKRIREIADEIYRLSDGSSREIQTISYLLRHLVRHVGSRTYDSAENPISNISGQEFTALTKVCLHEIDYLARHIIDLRAKERVVRLFSIATPNRYYISNNPRIKIAGFRDGIDIDELGAPAVRFIDLLKHSVKHGIFYREAFRVIDGNGSLVLDLLRDRVYAPLRLVGVEGESVFGENRLDLIRIEPVTRFDSEGVHDEYQLWYANLSRVFRFTHNIKQGHLATKYYDPESRKSPIELFSSATPKHRGNETIMVQIRKRDLEAEYRRNRGLMLKVRLRLVRHDRYWTSK